MVRCNANGWSTTCNYANCKIASLSLLFTGSVKTALPHSSYDPDCHLGMLSAGRRQPHRQVPKPHYGRSEEHTSELQSLMRISYAVFCLKKKKCRQWRYIQCQLQRDL